MSSIVISVRASERGWRLACPLLASQLSFGARRTAEAKAHCLARSLAAIGREVEIQVYDASASLVACLDMSPAAQGRWPATRNGVLPAGRVVPFPPRGRAA